MHCFCQRLPVKEVLKLWDRILAYDSLYILPGASVETFDDLSTYPVECLKVSQKMQVVLCMRFCLRHTNLTHNTLHLNAIQILRTQNPSITAVSIENFINERANC